VTSHVDEEPERESQAHLTTAGRVRRFLRVDADSADTTGERSQHLPLRLAILAFFGTYGTLVALALMTVVFWIMQPAAFGTFSNARNVLTDMAPGVIIALGLTVPLMTGDFDLSVGYQASFACVLVVGLLSNQALSIPVAILIILAIGIGFGLINGILVTVFGVNAFIATLGTGTVIIGLNYLYSGGVPVSLTRSLDFTNIGLASSFGIPNPILIMAAVGVVLWFALNVTSLGQHVRAVGDDADVSRRLGIRVSRVRIIAFVIAGLCAAGGGVLIAGTLGNGDTTAGDGYLLQSYAAAFLGSAALRDGEFHVIGTFIGVLTVAVGYNGLAIIGTPTFTQYFFSGGLLVIAVALSTLSRKFTHASGAEGR
jgi:ribose transport system permease protein